MHCLNTSSSSTRGILVLTPQLSKYVYNVQLAHEVLQFFGLNYRECLLHVAE